MLNEKKKSIFKRRKSNGKWMGGLSTWYRTVSEKWKREKIDHCLLYGGIFGNFFFIRYCCGSWFFVGFQSTVEKRDFYHELTMKNIHIFWNLEFVRSKWKKPSKQTATDTHTWKKIYLNISPLRDPYLMSITHVYICVCVRACNVVYTLYLQLNHSRMLKPH